MGRGPSKNMTKAELVAQLRLVKIHAQHNDWDDAIRVLDAVRPVLVERREAGRYIEKVKHIRVRRHQGFWKVFKSGAPTGSWWSVDLPDGRERAIAYAHKLAADIGGKVVEIQD